MMYWLNCKLIHKSVSRSLNWNGAGAAFSGGGLSHAVPRPQFFCHFYTMVNFILSTLFLIGQLNFYFSIY